MTEYIEKVLLDKMADEQRHLRDMEVQRDLMIERMANIRGHIESTHAKIDEIKLALSNAERGKR